MSKRVHSRLDIIYESGQHLLALINDILDLAKVAAGKIELCPQPVDLAAVLGMVTDVIRVKGEEKGLLFTYQPDFALSCAIMADEKRLRQVLLNLLANAVKFTPCGQVGLTVTLTAVGPDSARLRFEVTDTGIGIAPEHLETIFQPFEQAGDATSRVAGTGLGLPISRQLVHLMGGDLEVESSPGHGSCFSFELAFPLVDASPSLSVAPGTIIGYEGARRTILVADDVANNRALLVDLLEGLGFAVSVATNGQEAIKCILDTRPDLVIMDVGMPVLDGLSAIHRLRRISALGRLPIIAVSSSAHAEDTQGIQEAGADIFLLQPVENRVLLRHLGELLGLVWCYKAPDTVATESKDSSVPLSQEDLEFLYQFARLGNMASIIEYAANLTKQNGGCHPVISRLSSLAQGYQSKAVLALVEDQLRVRSST